MKVVPYALANLPIGAKILNGERIQRAYGQLGIRSSLPFWSVDPNVHSTLWNVNGIAHKVDSTPISRIPIRIKTWKISPSTTKSMTTTFKLSAAVWASKSITIPCRAQRVQRAARCMTNGFYAVRRGSQDWVTGPTEIADDLTVVRLGAEQRWQTKRGMPGQQHIIDWITLDTNMEIFPKPEENFDQTAGMFDYDFHWFMGDRLTMLSYGGFDFFTGGQRWTTERRAFSHRPPRGSIFLGFNTFEGPISSEVITASYTYRMTQKWLSTFGTSFDHEEPRQHWRKFPADPNWRIVLVHHGL